MEKYRKLIITILTIIAVACLTGAICIIIGQTIQNRQTEADLNALRSSLMVQHDETAPESSIHPETDETAPVSSIHAETDETQNTVTEPPQEPEAAEKQTESTAVPNPYEDIFADYEDMVAWLQIPDTIIDYPVMWTPGDEEYYLRRDYRGNKDNNGSLILDTDSCIDPLTTNLIIHGHNMSSGTMFATLLKYDNQDFYEKHKQIILYTDQCRRNYEIIAVFRSEVFKKKDTVFKYYNFFQANTQEEFDDFYQNIKNMSLYDTGVTAEFGDRFITLSTCSYHVERGRFVVVAKETEPGDTYLPAQE